MAYDVTISINVDVKDGPKVKATIKPLGITDANAKKVMFYNDASCKQLKFTAPEHRPMVVCSDPTNGYIAVYCKKIRLLQPDKEKLAFLSIKAPKYTFKSCPEGDVPGVGFALYSSVECEKFMKKSDGKDADYAIQNDYDQGILETSKVIWISSEYVTLNQCNLDNAHDDYLYLIVRPQMFECSKDPKAAFEITVTYGIRGEAHNENDFQDCCAAQNQTPAQMQHAYLQNARSRSLV
ncbi:MAG: hypothetical protein U0892_04265 [Pirellulales bacterium]